MKSKKKHFPLKDANGQYIGGPIGDSIGGGRIALKVPTRKATVLWAYFEPVPPGSVMTVEVPNVFPFENVPVTEGAGAGKVFASDTAGSTPGGVRATIVSAKRADQVLNVRLRLTLEPGETADTLHNRLDSYFYFKDVFLFDPVAKPSIPWSRTARASSRLNRSPSRWTGAGLSTTGGRQHSSASAYRRRPIRCSAQISTCPSSCPLKP